AAPITFLLTELRALPEYADDERALRSSPGGTEALLTSFVTLPSPVALPSPPDTSLTFAPESLSVGVSAVPWVRAIWLGDELPLAFVSADADTLWVSTDWGEVETFPFPAGSPAEAPTPTAIAAFDYDYDFRLDLAVAGRAGIRLLRQADVASFTDVTAEAIPDDAARGEYSGVWTADIEMDGDMDLIAARAEGAPMVLRNRGDGTCDSYDAFDGVDRLRGFVWADLDDDGDPDASLLDAGGRLHVYLNGRHRFPQFEPAALPDTLGRAAAIAAGDLNKDATLELITVGGDGRLNTLSASPRGWVAESLGAALELATDDVARTRLFVADIDNNGDLDLVASTPDATRVWLSTANGWHALEPLNLYVTEIADIGGEGRLDLIGAAADGQAWWLINEGTTDYFATSINPRAASATGDRRINSFGIGGEIEVRAGLLYQKQLIDDATVHFGLGRHANVDVARIIWPNGTVQAEFNVSGTNRFVTTLQRLKGSCPWVFAFDGSTMRFVTDFLWRTGLGLRINAQGKTAVMHGDDWIRIRGDQLASRDGFYDISITAELWETHFFDHVALMVVDHPEGTEMLVDERFTLPAPAPALHLTQPLRPIARAVDESGRDVTALVRELDERYLDTFELGAYQGLAEEHYVEITLGDDAHASGPLRLVASGWVYPTDASINVALSQGENVRPRGLQLEVANGDGGWTIVERDIGFPSGKTKTILIDLEHAFEPDAERRVRLRTNMEVYWDRIAWTVALPDAHTRTQRLLPDTAELRYRGFSAVRQAGRKAPELPDYDVATTTTIWRDLIGYYTRFGDVRELNHTVDDRYVIMNAGDELRLRFPAPPPPADGWTRDFVLIGDGWVKDGDYNTGYSETVRPLPYHGLTDYGRPPGRLDEDPGYQRHPEDWSVYHTRYVTPRSFHRALVPQRDE
ncbi:MAG: CRTAC1 family protein, partial [Longimicrobiales bacterium]